MDPPDVAPRAGAWIETLASLLQTLQTDKSPPVRGRGLKHYPRAVSTEIHKSPPVRGRGLKQIKVRIYARAPGFAPRAGAWIETCLRSIVWPWGRGRPPCRGVD